MRLVVAAMLHETNTFSPIPTDVARFGHRDMRSGPEARRYFKGTNTAISAFRPRTLQVGAQFDF